MIPDKWEGISMLLDKLNDKKYLRAQLFILLCLLPFLLNAIANLIEVMK